MLIWRVMFQSISYLNFISFKNRSDVIKHLQMHVSVSIVPFWSHINNITRSLNINQCKTQPLSWSGSVVSIARTTTNCFRRRRILSLHSHWAPKCCLRLCLLGRMRSLVREAFSYGIRHILLWFTKHKVILHWITMKYAVSRMKMPPVREYSSSLLWQHFQQKREKSSYTPRNHVYSIQVKYWGKKTSQNPFDITIGCYHGYDSAESCELVDYFLLHEIGKRYCNIFGWSLQIIAYDGLGVTMTPPRQVELIKKGLCDIFKRCGLKITI